jgi:hypothetical protein
MSIPEYARVNFNADAVTGEPRYVICALCRSRAMAHNAELGIMPHD